MRRVMIGDVVDIRMLPKQLRTVFEIDPHNDATWFGGFIGGDADQEFPTQLQCRCSIRCAIDDIG